MSLNLRFLCACLLAWTTQAIAKPDAAEALKLLQEGNARFASGSSRQPNADEQRRRLAATSDQGDYAIATVVSCSDSRVPVEILFDSGIMDLFVVRVAGNVCDTDEIGSIEYGICHVNTPILLVLGHTQCGAVTAVAKQIKGEGHPLERNIPPLVDNIVPAVQKVLTDFPQASLPNLITRSIEQNIWTAIGQVFLASPAVRERALSGKVRVLGAIYDLESGTIAWLSEDRVRKLAEDAAQNPDRMIEPMAPHSEHETTHEKPLDEAAEQHSTTPPGEETAEANPHKTH